MDDIRKTIIENLIFYRKKRGLKQKEFAEAIGSKKSTVSTWESCKNAPSIEALYTICKKLDISISDLFGKYANEKNKEEFSSEIQEILKKAEDLNKTGQERLLEQAELLGAKYKKNDPQ